MRAFAGQRGLHGLAAGIEEVGLDQGRQPNVFGLYDLGGNVFEWLEDCVHDSYQGAPTDGSAWLESDSGNCDIRVIRGGSWGNGPVGLRVSNRDRGHRDNRNNDIGFRLAQDIE